MGPGKGRLRASFSCPPLRLILRSGLTDGGHDPQAKQDHARDSDIEAGDFCRGHGPGYACGEDDKSDNVKCKGHFFPPLK